MLFGDEETASRARSGFAPADVAMLQFLTNNPDRTSAHDLNWIFPVSYWYPPVFWQDWTRFAGNSPTRPVANVGNRFYIRRNKISDTLAPSKKVQMFERADFYQKANPLPQWNNPIAQEQVACVDGSAKSVRMSDIIAKTATDPGLTPPLGSDLLQPAGGWGVGQSGLTNQELQSFFVFTGSPAASSFQFDVTPPKPAYFWATRNGIRGIDLN
jgi:hypothetical protein